MQELEVMNLLIEDTCKLCDRPLTLDDHLIICDDCLYSKQKKS